MNNTIKEFLQTADLFTLTTWTTELTWTAEEMKDIVEFNIELEKTFYFVDGAMYMDSEEGCSKVTPVK